MQITRGRMREGVLNSRAYLVVSWIFMAIIAGTALLLATRSRWVEAAALGGLVLLALVFIASNDRLPRVFTALFLLAGAVNAAGFVFSLWHALSPYDDVVHAFTSFTGSAAIGWYLSGARSLSLAGHPTRRVLVVVAIGIVIGLAWEAFEWAIGIIGSTRDTLIDLGMDTIGATLAGLFCVWAIRKGALKSAS